MSVSRFRLPSPDLPAGRRSVLVIATTTYQDPQLLQLRAPATDAIELARVLGDPRIGGFEVSPVVDRSSHEMRLAIEEFLADRKPGDLVMVYISCHGVTDARRRLHFTATDTLKSRLAATGIDSAWVSDLMEQCRARRQILILDCCFSGAFARGAKGAESVGLDQLIEPGRGRVVLTASNASEYSYESSTSEPSPDSPAPGSVFTAALIAGLREGDADADGDGYVTVDEAYYYAYQHVRASGVAQTPQRWVSGGEGQLLLARNPAGRPVVFPELSDSLRTALESPHPGVRIGAINELRNWLTSEDVAKISTAIRQLTDVAANDIARVSAAAQDALRSVPSNSSLLQSMDQADPHPTQQTDTTAAMHRQGTQVKVRTGGFGSPKRGRETAVSNADAAGNFEEVPAEQLDSTELDSARRWYNRAAVGGDIGAMKNLGYLLANKLDPPDLQGARRWYEQAADAGHTDAMHELGCLLAYRVDPPDLDGARRWYEQAAEAGNTKSMFNLGNLLATKLDPPDLNGARRWYGQAADAGNSLAMNNLGRLLQFKVDPPDLDGARRWYEQAAEAGNSLAMNNLGALLESKIDPPDLDGARRWYEQAAKAGHTDAMFNLGYLLATKLDPPDLDVARRWYEQAADAGNSLAMNNLGALLATKVDPPDLKGARRWYEQAANAGNSLAMNNLGRLLEYEVYPPDLHSARQWYTQAAKAGNNLAMNNLGRLLEFKVRPPDLDGSRRWYEQAAKAGHTDAMFNSGRLLEFKVEPPDLDGARRWYEQAAQAGHTDAMHRLDLLESKVLDALLGPDSKTPGWSPRHKFSKDLLERLRPFERHPWLKLYPHIPVRSLTNSRVSAKVPASDTVLAIIDLTIFGGAKRSMVISDSGIYWNAYSGAGSYSYSKLSGLEISSSLNRVSIGGDSIDVGGYSTDKIAEMLRAVRDVVRG